MGKHVIETIMGAVVLLVAAGFLVFAYRSSEVSSAGGYKLLANFDRADGLGVGTDVRISGIKVGYISEQTLNPKTYLAEVAMTIDESVKIPTDSVAEVASDGLLGGKYLAIIPGADTSTLKEGQRIKYTQSSISIESLIGKFMYGGADAATPDTKEKSKPEETPDHVNVLD